MFDPQSPSIQTLSRGIFADEIQKDPVFAMLAPYRLPLDVVLVIDATEAFVETLKEIPDVAIPIDCLDSERWLSGLTITNILKGVRIRSTTNYIQAVCFSEAVFRSQWKNIFR